jgi:Activator of Hsp90 ATPase homolog 1-like protein
MSKTPNTIEFKFQRTISALPSDACDAWLSPQVPGNPWNMADKLILQPKVGGLFYWALKGTTHYGRFMEVDRSHRIQQSWVSPSTLGEESTVTVSFEKNGIDAVHQALATRCIEGPHLGNLGLLLSGRIRHLDGRVLRALASLLLR